jgi:arylsulfatase A-like enzyme
VVRRLLGDQHRFIGRKSADHVNATFLEWLDDRGQDRPFFAFLNYFDAHLPYAPPAPFDTLYEPARRNTTFLQRLRRELEKKGSWDLPEGELAAEVAAYEASIAYLDDRLGQLLAQIEARGLADRTLVIVASDHGEEFGEHGAYEHGGNLYFEQTHVPLVIAGAGVPEGIVIEHPVSVRDLPSTVMDLVEPPRRVAFPGGSLARFWTSPVIDGEESVFAELVPGRDPEHRMASLIAGGYQYIALPDGSTELYDVGSDWTQQNDLAASRAAAPILAKLQASAKALLTCSEFACCCTLPPGLFPDQRSAAPSAQAPTRAPAPPPSARTPVQKSGSTEH